MAGPIAFSNKESRGHPRILEEVGSGVPGNLRRPRGHQKVIARVATLDSVPDNIPADNQADFLRFVRSQPGCRGAYHLKSRDSKKGLSVSFWDDEASMQAGQNAVGQRAREGQRLGPSPDSLETYDVVEG